MVPQKAFSSEPLRTKVSYSKDKGAFKFELNTLENSIRSGEVEYQLVYKNDASVNPEQLENAHDKVEIKDEDFDTEVDAKTCSSEGACVGHSVPRGILKIEIKDNSWSESVWFEIKDSDTVDFKRLDTADLADFTDEEEYWLLKGVEMPTQTPVPTQEPTPTIVEDGDILDEGLFTSVTPTATVEPTIALGSTNGDEIVMATLVETDAQAYVDPAIWTDKGDYAPTEKVVVSGKNFIPDYIYTIVISSSDEPTVTHTGTVTASFDGMFTYEYQLDGNYRPNYKVEVKDKDGVLVAETTFTDSPFKVIICHSTSSQTNPYNLIEVAINSISKCEDVNGHGLDPHDIIPPFTYETCEYPGLNWDTNGEAILENGCKPISARCGDGSVNQESEECDDGNQDNTDYCTNDCVLNAVCLPDVNMMVNGDFENPDVVNSKGWDIFNKFTANLGWSSDWYNVPPSWNDYDRPENSYIELHNGVNSWIPKSGSQYAELDSDWFGPDADISGEPASTAIWQDLATIPGVEYEVIFSYSPRPGADATNNSMKFSWAGDDKESFSQAGSTNTSWTEKKYTLKAETNKTRIQFTDIGTPNSEGMFLDNISVKCLGPVVVPCVEGAAWAGKIETANQGKLKNGNTITDPLRTDPSRALGVNDGLFFSLGYGGSIIVSFAGYVVDKPNSNDLSFHEVANGRPSYPIEKALIEVSKDGINWVNLGEVDNKAGGNGIAYKDLNGTGLDWIKFVKITDTTNDSRHIGTADGYDLDAVDATEQVCEEPEPTTEVKLCKTIDNQPAQGWDMILSGRELVNTYSLDTGNPSGITIPSLTTGDYYQIEVSGTWNNGNIETRDAFYSAAGVNVGNLDPVNTGIYDPRIIKFVVDGKPTALIDFPSFWGAYDSSSHTYTTVYQTTGTSLNIKLWDFPIGNESYTGWYDDNRGSLIVSLYRLTDQRVETTVTDGCATFADVSDGSYYMNEVPQTGYQMVSGPQYPESVSSTNNTFTFTNRPYELPIPKASVTVCKEDTLGHRLEGWNVALKGELVDTVTVLPNGSDYASETIPAGDYVLEASGYYTYRPGTANAEYTDANYSKRHPSDAVYGGEFVPWVNVNTFPAPHTGWLGVMVNGSARNWSDYLAGDHVYTLGYPGYTDTSFSFKILDDNYGDNSGSIPVNIYEGYAGVTGTDGCVTFKDVPMGDYTLQEILHADWRKVSGEGSITIDEAQESFTLVNDRLPGNLEVKKIVDWAGVTPDTEKEFQICITGPSYPVGNCQTADYNGDILSWTDLLPGDYTVTETDPGGAWLVTGSGNVVTVSSRGTAEAEITNTANPLTIKAYKIVCLNESDLPNWSDSSAINETKINEFLADNPRCHKAQGWDFQYGFADKTGADGVDKLIGTHIGPADGTSSTCSTNCGTHTFTGTDYDDWKTFGSTDTNGLAETKIMDLEGAPGIWVRENLKADYVPYTYPPEASPGDDISAEMYCHNDVNKYDNYDQITGLQYGATYYCVALNAQAMGTVTGHKYHDMNGDGDWDTDELGLSGWTIFWDRDNDGEFDQGPEPHQITDDSGYYEFDNLPTRQELKICEQMQTGWTQTSTPVCHTVTVNPGQTIENKDFGNFELGAIQGRKYEDLNMDGTRQTGESWLPGWTIRLYDAEWNLYDGTNSLVTNANGLYRFEGMTLGTYYTCEVLTDQTGWTQTGPIVGGSNRVINNSPNKDEEGPVCWRAVIDRSGRNRTGLQFGNIQYGDITVIKFNDINGDGAQDEGEETLPNWEINLTGQDSQMTDATGEAYFGDLIPDTYYLSETMQEGWTQTGISCTYEGEPVQDPNSIGLCHWNEGTGRWNALYLTMDNPGHAGHTEDYPYDGPRKENGHPTKEGDAWCLENAPVDGIVSDVSAQDIELPGYPVEVNAGDSIVCMIGNQHIPAELTLSKYNTTWPNNTSAGSDVEYHLVLTVTENSVHDLFVTDLPPAGFKYNPGSWKCYRNGSQFACPEPTYASPGDWLLGDAEKGDEFELVYTASIDSSQKPGLYKDLAWGYGCQTTEGEGCNIESPDAILADAVDSGTDDPGTFDGVENFVGTKVLLAKNDADSPGVDIKKEEKKEVNESGDVLGASTGLPGTGSPNIWIIISILMTMMGLVCMGIGLMKKRSFAFAKHMIAVAVIISVLFSFGARTTAANGIDYLTIRLEQPKSPTRVNDFSLGFVTMDLKIQPITVRCFMKKPSTGYSQIGGDLAIAAGGNSGLCPLTSSMINEKGTYQFYATAHTASDNATSETITVDYNTDGPGTPTNYSKEEVSDCEYKISWRTADDGGKTTRVEIYRSESNTSFSADAGSRRTTIYMGSNQNGTYNDVVGDCAKTYYYVLRAFDSADNGSGLVGDSVTIVTTTTTTTTTTTGSGGTTGGGAIPVANATVAPGATEGTVEGAEEERGSAPETEETEEGAVLGEETEKGANPMVSAITWMKANKLLTAGGILILAALVYGLIQYAKKKKETDTTTQKR